MILQHVAQLPSWWRGPVADSSCVRHPTVVPTLWSPVAWGSDGLCVDGRDDGGHGVLAAQVRARRVRLRRPRACAAQKWDGIRSFQARNFLRAMRTGELAIFYHSNAKPPGAAGVCRVVAEAEPDETQFDPTAEYYDPTAKHDDPRWDIVTVAPVRKLRFIPIDELRTMPELAGSACSPRATDSRSCRCRTRSSPRSSARCHPQVTRLTPVRLADAARRALAAFRAVGRRRRPAPRRHARGRPRRAQQRRQVVAAQRRRRPREPRPHVEDAGAPRG